MSLAADIRRFNQRLRENHEKPKKDNAALMAGSPMYFYCRGCEINHATLPENYTTPAPRHCEDCQRLIEAGQDIPSLRQQALAGTASE